MHAVVQVSTRETVYIWRKIEARSCTNCLSGQTMSVKHSDCVFIALDIQRAVRMSHTACHLWPARLYNIFLRCLINDTILGKKNIEHKMCASIFCTIYVEIFLILRRIWRNVIKIHLVF
jgi:hypothetical protein